MSHNYSILIVNDCQNRASRIAAALRDFGYRLTIADCAESVGRESFDLLICGDGETRARLRTQRKFKTVPIITASQNEESENAAADDDFFDIETSLPAQIAARISRLIERRRARQNSPENEKRPTDRRQLKAARERLESALRAARTVWWEWDISSDSITVSENFTQVYGVLRMKDAADGFARLHPDDKERHVKIVLAAAASGKSYHSEYRLFRGDTNAVVWLEETATAILDRNGKTIKLVGVSVDVTQRKEAEIALRQSEEKFRARYKGIPIPTTTWQRKGDDFIFVDYNDAAAEKIRKVAIETYIGKTAKELFAHSPHVLRAIEQCCDEKTLIQFEAPYQHFSADKLRQIDFSFVFAPPDLVMIHMRDITDYKESIERLKESDYRYQMASRATNDALWDWNLTDGTLLWNENFYRMFGYSTEEVPLDVDFWYENIHPEDRAEIEQSLEEILAGSENYWSGNYRFRKRDDTFKYIFDRAYITRDETGKPLRMIGAMMDITASKEAEAALRFQKTLLESQLEASIDGILLVNADGEIISHNRRFAEMWEIPTALLETKDAAPVLASILDKIVDPAEFTQTIAHLSVHTDERRSTEITLQDGRVFERYTAPISDDENVNYGRVWFFHDITKRKLAQEALRKSEERLHLSQKLESVGRLAGGIAHDFNNMLMAINGYSDLILAEKNCSEQLRENVIEIKKAGERSAALTQQLLAFSRRQILQPKLVNLNQIVQDMSRMLNHLIGEHIELKIICDENECPIKADPGQISQVIMNLIVNARDALPDGGAISVETACVSLDEAFSARYISVVPGEYVRLTVSDNGIGIEESEVEHVFEPFFTTKEVGKGTGLGLATVYGIVKQSDGYIWVESARGEGTTFNLYLPRVSVAVKDNEENRKVSDEPAPTPVKATVLLVEDEKSVRQLTRKILEMGGYNIIEAANGAEALRLCEQQGDCKIDLLVTDVVMPQMGGRILAEKFVLNNPSLPVLYMSGYIDDMSMLRDGVDAEINFIQKPFAPGALLEKVNRLLNNTI